MSLEELQGADEINLVRGHQVGGEDGCRAVIAGLAEDEDLAIGRRIIDEGRAGGQRARRGTSLVALEQVVVDEVDGGPEAVLDKLGASGNIDGSMRDSELVRDLLSAQEAGESGFFITNDEKHGDALASKVLDILCHGEGTKIQVREDALGHSTALVLPFGRGSLIATGGDVLEHLKGVFALDVHISLVGVALGEPDDSHLRDRRNADVRRGGRLLLR